jgi:hypothetical protein
LQNDPLRPVLNARRTAASGPNAVTRALRSIHRLSKDSCRTTHTFSLDGRSPHDDWEFQPIDVQAISPGPVSPRDNERKGNQSLGVASNAVRLACFDASTRLNESRPHHILTSRERRRIAYLPFGNTVQCPKSFCAHNGKAFPLTGETLNSLLPNRVYVCF